LNKKGTTAGDPPGSAKASESSKKTVISAKDMIPSKTKKEPIKREASPISLSNKEADELKA